MKNRLFVILVFVVPLAVIFALPTPSPAAQPEQPIALQIFSPSRTLLAGKATTFSVSIDGPPLSVTLSISASRHIAGQFYPSAIVTPPASSTLILTTSAETRAGVYPVSVSGYIADLTETVPITLNVTASSTIYLPVVMQNYDPTWLWADALTLTLKPAPSNRYPLLSIDALGRPHIFWDTFSTPHFIYHTYLDSSGWSTPTAVAQSLGTSYVLYPPLVRPDGSVHLLWLNGLTSSGPCRLLYAVFTNGTWSPEEQVYQIESACSTAFRNLQGMVHTDDGGGVHATIVSSDYFSSSIYHRVRRSGQWSSPVEIPHPTYLAWIWPDRHGGVHLYGNDYANPPKLYYSYWQAGRFLVRDRQAVGKVSGRQTQLDGLNNLHIYWTAAVPVPGGQVTGLYHQCLDNQLNLAPEQVVSGQKSVSTVVKAAGNERRFALAWYVSGDKLVQEAMWDGCTQTDLKSVPLPVNSTWTPQALAIGDNPGKTCLLALASGYPPNRYALVCADLLD